VDKIEYIEKIKKENEKKKDIIMSKEKEIENMSKLNNESTNKFTQLIVENEGYIKKNKNIMLKNKKFKEFVKETVDECQSIVKQDFKSISTIYENNNLKDQLKDIIQKYESTDHKYESQISFLKGFFFKMKENITKTSLTNTISKEIIKSENTNFYKNLPLNLDLNCFNNYNSCYDFPKIKEIIQHILTNSNYDEYNYEEIDNTKYKNSFYCLYKIITNKTDLILNVEKFYLYLNILTITECYYICNLIKYVLLNRINIYTTLANLFYKNVNKDFDYYLDIYFVANKFGNIIKYQNYGKKL